eukprot:EG_transcript_14853
MAAKIMIAILGHTAPFSGFCWPNLKPEGPFCGWSPRGRHSGNVPSPPPFRASHTLSSKFARAKHPREASARRADNDRQLRVLVRTTTHSPFPCSTACLPSPYAPPSPPLPYRTHPTAAPRTPPSVTGCPAPTPHCLWRVSHPPQPPFPPP